MPFEDLPFPITESVEGYDSRNERACRGLFRVC